MKVSRHGIVSMPIRLTVSLLIIALMVPPISALADNIQDGMEDSEVRDSAERLRDCISSVYSKGPSYIVHVEMRVPDGCHLIIGGEQNTSIRMFVNDEPAGWVFTDIPVDGDETVLYGDILLEISNVIDGEQKVSVIEI